MKHPSLPRPEAILSILIALPAAVTSTTVNPIHHPLLFNPIHHPELVYPFAYDTSAISVHQLSKRAGQKPLKITNNCPNTIWPAITSQAGQGPGTGGFELGVGRTRDLKVSADWQGRVWGRTNCTFTTGPSGASGQIVGVKSCQTGDCGALSCVGAGEVPVTLAEFLLSSSSHQSFYDISLVDGYNLPLAIVLLPDSASTADIPPNLTNPVCIGTAALLEAEGFSPYSSSSTSVLGTNSTYPLPFDTTQTADMVSRWCPWSLQLSPPAKPGDGVYPYPDDKITRPPFDPCFSACAKNNKPSDCCTGSYNSPQACKPSLYSQSAKKVCPDAYSYAYDDQTSTFVVPDGGGFEVVFCPKARSTNILATKGKELTLLSQTGHARRGLGTDMEMEASALERRAVASARAQFPRRESMWGLVVAMAYGLFGGGGWF